MIYLLIGFIAGILFKSYFQLNHTKIVDTKKRIQKTLKRKKAIAAEYPLEKGIVIKEGDPIRDDR